MNVWGMFFRKFILLSLSIYTVIGAESVMAACYSSSAGEYCLTNKKYTCPAGCYCGAASEPDGALDKKGNKQKDIYQDQVAAWCSNGKACPWSAGSGQCGTSDKAKVFRCPVAFSFSDTGSKKIEDCYTYRNGDYKNQKLFYKKMNCPAGKYLPKNTDSCSDCKNDANTYCPGIKDITPSITADQGLSTCPNNQKPNSLKTGCESNAVTCSLGQYLPANTLDCTTCKDGFYCLGGSFNKSSSDQGLSTCPNNQKPNSSKTGCESNAIQCDIGQYLPANSNSCVKCKDKYYACSGGGFYTNNFDQGITHCEDGYVQNEDKTQCVYVADTDYNCDAGYYLPANKTKCEKCKSNKKYCPGGTFQYYDLDQGIYTCPYTSVANSDHSACVLYLSKDYMKYGPNGENTDLQDQCWTQKTDEDYVKCIYSERDPRKHSNSYMSAKKYNMEYSNGIVDILKDSMRSTPVAEEKTKRKNTPVVVEKGNLDQALLDSTKK